MDEIIHKILDRTISIL